MRFSIWAPEAEAVLVMGDFENWSGKKFSMENIGDGIWEILIPDVPDYSLYQYRIITKGGKALYKLDPVGFFAGVRPKTESVVYELDGFPWTDEEWDRSKPHSSLDQPLNIYEVHLGSWQRHEDGSFYTYRELAEVLPKYAKEMGYTHIEIMPLMEHPLDESWGYQVMGYFAPTSRYGTPHDLMYFVDICHGMGIGVIMDWVAGHFSKDEKSLGELDGSFCYEPDHPLRRDSEEWGTSYFDFDKPEVRSFLISNAIYWLELYHFDGLRVDAVTSMLYLDYKKESWLPNDQGGRENRGAISFLQDLNCIIHLRHPKALMIAEEAESFPKVTESVDEGGLGFTYKWNLGWGSDILSYMGTEPSFRSSIHNKLTFMLIDGFSENFILPFSHDEVANGKKSLFCEMPGDYQKKFANLRLLFGYMMAYPGKKLTFMGEELGSPDGWDFNRKLDWSLLGLKPHKRMQDYVKKLNEFYLQESCFWQMDRSWEGFSWLEPDDNDHSVISFLRFDKEGRHIVVACNFSDRYQKNYRLGAPVLGTYQETFYSDDENFGGPDRGYGDNLISVEIPWQNQKFSLVVDLPPLSVVYLLADQEREEGLL